MAETPFPNRRITIRLTDKELEAIRHVAARERRTTRDQAAILLRDALVQLGLLEQERRNVSNRTDNNAS